MPLNAGPKLTGDGVRPIVILWLFGLLGGIVVSPLLWTQVPVMMDYPNHLARIWIQTHASETTEYVVAWRLLPNLAAEILVPPLAWLMQLELAGRVFIAVAMLLPIAASLLLWRALHGHWSAWPLGSALFAFHLVLVFGFLNYLFTLGAALFTFSLWVMTRGCPISWRLIGFALASCALFVMHLFAFGLYVLLILSYEATRNDPDSWPRRAMAVVQFMPAALLWLLTLGQGGPGYTAFGSPWTKLLALQAPMGFGAIPGSLMVVLVLAAIMLLRRGRLRLHPDLRWPFVALMVVAIFMPNWLSGSWGADFRIPVALPYLFFGATRPQLSFGATCPRDISVPFARGVAVVALSFLLFRTAALSASWSDLDRDYAEFRAASVAMPLGARLMIVQEELPASRRQIGAWPRGWIERQPNDYYHMPMLAVIDRKAFVPYLFNAWSLTQPAPRNAARATLLAIPATVEQFEAGADASASGQAQPNVYQELSVWRNWPSKFDHVLWLDFGNKPAQPPARLRPIATGSYFTLYAVQP